MSLLVKGTLQEVKYTFMEFLIRFFRYEKALNSTTVYIASLAQHERDYTADYVRLFLDRVLFVSRFESYNSLVKHKKRLHTIQIPQVSTLSWYLCTKTSIHSKICGFFQRKLEESADFPRIFSVYYTQS